MPSDTEARGTSGLLDTSKKLTVDLDWIDSLYGRMGNMEVLLDDDPLAYGPARLQQKIEQVRTHLSEVERVYIDLRAVESRLKRSHRRISSAVELMTSSLLANDPHVIAGSSMGERNARAMVKLAEEHEEIHRLADCLADIDEALIVVKSKKADLKDILSRLRDQMKLCSEQKWLGDSWGSKRDNAPVLKTGQGLADRLLGASQEELDRLINKNQPDVQNLEAESEVAEDPFGLNTEEEISSEEPKQETFSEEPKQEEENSSEEIVFDVDNVQKIPLEEACPGVKTEKELEREMGFLDDTISKMDHETSRKKASAKDFATAPVQDVASLIDALS